ncbi:chemotaxis protein CheE [Caulobacter endophyticus]|uniref:Chemotaxis protein CheE n=1 Tax=Caulobacter endophyticus TaxID=2172652 RepID=A0A2T9JQD2_9CAUL|nr:chemotaxis protein CheE [Caulobacter endophyticus]PVM85903.1 chemotaxis protein CheE [Caulobacter endophyticus]
MTVRKFRPPNRLASMIKDRGGILAKDAVAAAEANIETLRESSLAALDAALEAIEARFGPVAPDRGGEDFETLYTMTLKIVDVSGFAADAGVDEAAVSLCALVDACAEAKAWRWDAVDVHLSALRLLRNVGASLPAEHRRGMLEGLHKVVQR